jgi:hypothetical protein
VGARFFARVQNGPGADPVSCTMGTGSFPGVKRPGRGADHPPLSSVEVKKYYSYTSTPSLLGLRVCYGVPNKSDPLPVKEECLKLFTQLLNFSLFTLSFNKIQFIYKNSTECTTLSSKCLQFCYFQFYYGVHTNYLQQYTHLYVLFKKRLNFIRP